MGQTVASRGPLRILGLMSGTSLDGIDAALVDVSYRGGRLRLATVATHTRAYPRRLRERLLVVAEGGALPAAELARLSISVARAFSMAAVELVQRAGARLDDVDAVASHGQTVTHLPAKGTVTVQLGEGCVLAERTGLTTVSEFRLADTAAGGQGAPLVPFVHHALFAHRTRLRAVENLGGMGNLTVLPPGAGIEAVSASDTGPGNILIDCCAHLLSGGRLRMDDQGRWAAEGSVDERLVNHVLAAPFFRRRLPRSTGREDFGPELARQLVRLGRRYRLAPASILASVTMATARSVARACKRLAPAGIEDLYLCGGGSHNRTLTSMMCALLPASRIQSTVELGVDPDFVEAQAFALLGYLALEGIPGNVPAATGAAGPRVLGKISPGSNYRRTLLRARARITTQNSRPDLR